MRSRVCRSLRAFQARAKRVTRIPRRNPDVGAAQRPTNRGSRRVRRAIAGFVGLILVFVLEPEILRFTDWGQARAVPRGRNAHALVLSEQSRRFLVLQYKSYPTEFMGCMIGELRGSAIVVERIAPADVDPPKSATTHVIPKASCEASGWSHTVGMNPQPSRGREVLVLLPGDAGGDFGSTVVPDAAIPGTTRSSRSGWSRNE